MTAVTLRPTTDDDFEALFLLESDEVGADLVALIPRAPGDREAFEKHWQSMRADATGVNRVIEVDGAFAGNVVSFVDEGERQVGYWIDRSVWGRGIATRALGLLIAELDERPLWGRVAAHNVASRRVLEHLGFTMIGTERIVSPRSGIEIDELVLRLDA